MDIFTANEIRILKDWRQMAITSAEHHKYLKIAKYLSGSHKTSTWMVSKTLQEPCRDARKQLRKMERMGYVVAESNGSNSVYWSLKP